ALDEARDRDAGSAGHDGGYLYLADREAYVLRVLEPVRQFLDAPLELGQLPVAQLGSGFEVVVALGSLDLGLDPVELFLIAAPLVEDFAFGFPLRARHADLIGDRLEFLLDAQQPGARVWVLL